MSNKLNLVIDFNNIAFRALFTCAYMPDTQVSNFDTDEECAILIRKISMDVSHILKSFIPDRVIFACDAKEPWRNTLYGDIPGESYKGTRVKDETKNWKKIYEALDGFKDILKEKGFVVTEIQNTEADDLAALWKEYSFDNDENIVICSSDKDWSQLIELNRELDLFCIGFNPISNNKGRKKIYITDEIQTWLDTGEEVDLFFNNYNSAKQRIKDAQAKDNRIDYEVIYPKDILLDKIMCGDDGDNVPAFYDFFKNGKKVRLTPLKTKKIFEELNICNLNDLKDNCNNSSLKDALSKTFKREIDDVDTNERLMRQRRLVELNTTLFPQEIVDKFKNHATHNKNTGYINCSSIKMEDILKDTRYISKDFKKNVRTSSIFADMQEGIKLAKSSSLF